MNTLVDWQETLTFDQQTLLALSHVITMKPVFVYPPLEHMDVIAVLYRGKEIFGSSWGGSPKHTNDDFLYASQVSLSLGKLYKYGLVERISVLDTQRYFWKVNSNGEKLAEELFQQFDN